MALLFTQHNNFMENELTILEQENKKLLPHNSWRQVCMALGISPNSTLDQVLHQINTTQQSFLKAVDKLVEIKNLIEKGLN